MRNSEFQGGILEDAAALGIPSLCSMETGGIWDPWDVPKGRSSLIPTFDPNPNIPCSFPSPFPLLSFKSQGILGDS